MQAPIGKGIADGVDFSATLSLIRSLKDYQHKCILESIIAASNWPNARVNSIDSSVSYVCSRCVSAVDNSLHSFWQCCANSDIEDPAVQDTQYLVQAATNDSINEPCL